MSILKTVDMNAKSNETSMLDFIPLTQVFSLCRDFMLEACGTAVVKAIVLVGSFSRNEAIFDQTKEPVKFFSDIEFWVVAEPGAFAHIAMKKSVIERELERRLLEKGYKVKISVGFTTVEHLKRLKPYIYTFEVKRYGKVLWGDGKILDNIPECSSENIDPLDGFILLNNRIVEQLMLLNNIERGKSIDQYEINKGYIQVVNSILAFKKRYRSMYPEKREAILKLFEEDTDLLGRMTCFIAKIEPIFDSLSGVQPKPLTKNGAMLEWRGLRKCFKQAWIYEAQRLTNNDSHDIEKLLKAADLLSSAEARFKGWGKYFLKGGRGLPDIRTSPQALIYKRAVKEYFGRTPDMDNIKEIIADWEKHVK